MEQQRATDGAASLQSARSLGFGRLLPECDGADSAGRFFTGFFT
jgi:hypothetical protein